VHYHLPASAAHPEGLNVRVWRAYEDFVAELSDRFPHEASGIRAFYDECWAVFNALNVLELKSLEEPRCVWIGGPGWIACMGAAASSSVCTKCLLNGGAGRQAAPGSRSSRCQHAVNTLWLLLLLRYLLGQFARQPLACLTLAAYAPSNTGTVARKHIRDPLLLKFIDMECYIWSTVMADMTPMINAGMVRHGAARGAGDGIMHSGEGRSLVVG
jgi:hypothetical protein